MKVDTVEYVQTSVLHVYLAQELIGFIENILLFHNVKIPICHHVPVLSTFLHFLVQLLKGFLR